MTSHDVEIKRSTKPDFAVDRPDSIRISVELSARPDDVWTALFDQRSRHRGAVKAINPTIGVRDSPPSAHIVFLIVNPADLTDAVIEMDNFLARVHEEWDTNSNTIARRRTEDEKRRIEEELAERAARLAPPN